jgi:hypothetical protein
MTIGFKGRRAMRLACLGGLLFLAACSGNGLCPEDAPGHPVIPPDCTATPDGDGSLLLLSCEGGRTGFAFQP